MKKDDIYPIIAAILFIIFGIALISWNIHVKWIDYQAKKAIIRMEQKR